MHNQLPRTNMKSNSNRMFTLTVPCSGTIYYKTKFQHYQEPFGTDSKTLKDLVCFHVLANLKKKSRTLKDRQEPPTISALVRDVVLVSRSQSQDGLDVHQCLVSVSKVWRLRIVSAIYSFCHKLFPVTRCLGYAWRPWSRYHGIAPYKLTLCVVIIINGRAIKCTTAIIITRKLILTSCSVSWPTNVLTCLKMWTSSLGWWGQRLGFASASGGEGLGVVSVSGITSRTHLWHWY